MKLIFQQITPHHYTSCNEFFTHSWALSIA